METREITLPISKKKAELKKSLTMREFRTFQENSEKRDGGGKQIKKVVDGKVQVTTETKLKEDINYFTDIEAQLKVVVVKLDGKEFRMQDFDDLSVQDGLFLVKESGEPFSNLDGEEKKS